MASPSPKVTRAERVSSVALPPGQMEAFLERLRRNDMLTRIGLCVLVAAVLWLITNGWAPPFAYRSGYIPPRNIVARTEVRVEDETKTRELQDQTRRENVCFYANDERQFVEKRKALKNKVLEIVGSDSYESLDKSIWREFVLPTEDSSAADDEAVYQRFKEAFQQDKELTRFEDAIRNSLTEFEQTGLLKDIEHGDDGSQKTIRVHPLGNEKNVEFVDLEKVRITNAVPMLTDKLRNGLRSTDFPDESVTLLVPLLDHWLKTQLPVTLHLNEEASHRSAEEAAASVEPVMNVYYPHKDVLAPGGEPLTLTELVLLRNEHDNLIRNMSWQQLIRHSLADCGMYMAMFVLCGTFIAYRQPILIHDLRRFCVLLTFIGATVLFCWIASKNEWRAELIPLTLFAMAATIAYRHDVALLLSAVMTLLVTLTLGQGLVELVVYVSAVATIILLLDRVRSRKKLFSVGMLASIVTMLTALGVGTVKSELFGTDTAIATLAASDIGATIHHFLSLSLLGTALWYGFLTILSGILMTGLLPFVERAFDVQTDLSLLELGDMAHPLLQELVRRAPGTYNHSINVAAMAEAAADAIGANGLLCRVGSYFHDIGKMLKPQYFIENQGQEANCHDQLLPAMSTLVIIAHVKDGADLARKHRLPQAFIDFIEQHHGTTLVEYFYRQAEKAQQETPDSQEVDETNFRYPGPKPQSREAGVVMLADTVESACRTLVEPAPARIENLVREITMKKLLDRQFDECGLTLREIHLIEDSLVKSVTAVYHSRIKYPDQDSA